MMKYIYTEKQSINSYRDGETITAKTLTAAKRIASRKQFYRGTVLTIESVNGNLIAYKENGKWHSAF